jgi:fucose 4-O-acetylase-like acetyltransferase
VHWTAAIGWIKRSQRIDAGCPIQPGSEHFMRLLRLFFFYCVLSLLMLLPNLILAWPKYPQSVAGWLGFVFLPVPLAIAGEWLLEYRPFRLLRPLDAFGDYIFNSKYRLAIVATISVFISVLCYVGIFYIDVYLP